jgi:hypothetical protein
MRRVISLFREATEDERYGLSRPEECRFAAALLGAEDATDQPQPLYFTELMDFLRQRKADQAVGSQGHI